MGTISQPRRLVHLDLVRAAAIFLVLGRHQPMVAGPGSWGGALWVALDRCGWAGVDLFFCLSGFLIGGLLFAEQARTQAIDVRRFYIRRAFKIWPAYIVFLAAMVVWDAHKSHTTGLNAARGFWANYIHLQNYFGSPAGHTWSLGVEEHFYLFLPLLLVGLYSAGDRTFRAVPVIFGLLAVSCLAVRLHTASSAPYAFLRSVTPTHLRIDSLFAGVLLAYVVHQRPELVRPLSRCRLALLAAGLMCFAPTLAIDLESPWAHTWGFSVLMFGSMLITLWAHLAAEGDRPPGAATRVLAAVGAYSYSIYLWHNPFGQRLASGLFKALAHPQGRFFHVGLMIVYVLLSVGLGIVMFHLVERPSIALRDRLFPKRAGRRPVSRAPRTFVPGVQGITPAPINFRPSLEL